MDKWIERIILGSLFLLILTATSVMIIATIVLLSGG